MGLPTSYTPKRSLLGIGAALALCGLTLTARAEDIPLPQAANAPYSAPIAKLQVTGSADKFSVDADHADAKSLLSAIFYQANAQFTTDNSVAGQVTLRLSGQSLITTLDAVCRQLLIHYKKDSKGIYLFEQDIEAVRVAITRIKDQNALLRQQLRSYGLSLPEDSRLDSAPRERAAQISRAAGSNDPALDASAGAGGLGGGGGTFGGARGSSLKAGASATNRQGGRSSEAAGSPGALRSRALAKSDSAQNSLTNGLKYLTADTLAEIFAVNPQNNELQNPDSYRAFLKENGYVWINTGAQKTPVTEVLRELGRQSNTPILIDTSVPSGPKFVIQGYITPRSLPEALNILTQSSRLTWRMLGASVYVEALPDFQLFFNSTSPRVIFGSSALQTQQNGGQGQGQQGINSSNYALPSQTPLPITNGDKKTP